MKKSIFILATLFAATAAYAQITLEKTLDGFYTISANYAGDLYHYEQSPYIYNLQIETNSPSVPNESTQGAPRRAYANNKCVLNLYDVDDFSLYKTIEIENVTGSSVCLLSKNILSTDNKVCFCITGGDEHSYIYNEDGQLIATINGDGNIPPTLLKVNDRYLLICRDYEKTYIYSVPGNGEAQAQAVSTPSSPKRSARKIARDGQVLVQTDNNTYTLTGAEVK